MTVTSSPEEAPPAPGRWRRLVGEVQRWGPRLTVLLLAVVLVPLAVFPGAWRPFDLLKLLLIVVIAAVLLAMVAPQLRRGWQQAPTEAQVLAAAVWVLTGWVLVRTVTADVPLVAFLGLQTRFVGSLTVAAAAVLVVTVPLVVRTRADLDRVVVAFAVMLAILGVHAIAQATGWSQMPWRAHRYGKPVGTLGNPNMLGAIIAAGVPVAFYLWRAVPKLLIVVPTFLVVVATVLLQARSALGLLAALAGGVVYLALDRWPAERARLRHLVVGVAPALGHVAALVAVYLGHRVGLGSSTARVHLHALVWPMVAGAPLTGVGWGRFEAYHERTRPPEAVTLGSRGEVFADSSHDLLLDVAAESGLIGFALLLVVIAATGVVLARAARRSDASGGDPAPVHLLAAWSVVSGVGLSLTVPILAMVWLWLLVLGLVAAVAVMVAAAPGDRSPAAGPGSTRQPVGRVQGLLAVVMAVGVVVALLPLTGAAREMGAADDAWLDEEWAASVAAAERATLQAPWWPRAWATLGRGQQDAGDLEAARAAYQRAQELDPRHRAARRQLPVLAGELGDDAEAREAFAAAIREDPEGFEIRLYQAEWALGIGDEATAEQALDHADRYLEEGMDEWERYEDLRAALAAAGQVGPPEQG